MKFIRKLVIFILLLSLCILSLLFYAFKIEPYRLKVEEIRLEKKSSASSPLKIVQFSDTHLKANFTANDLAKVVDAINLQEADIIIFSGDLYDNYELYNDDSNVIRELKRLDAKLAKIAIWGNRDYGGSASNAYTEIMEQADFNLLKNSELELTTIDNKEILISGLDDSLLGNPELVINHIDYDYRILLSHEPDTLDLYIDYNYDLALAAHSHGGQVNIPYLTFVNEQALASTRLSTKYSNGMYELNDEGIRRIYVNSGVGTTHVLARFRTVPQITVFNINLK